MLSWAYPGNPPKDVYHHSKYKPNLSYEVSKTRHKLLYACRLSMPSPMSIPGVGTSSRRAKEAWLDLFLQVVDKHVPLKQHRVKYKTQPQWISPEILDAIKCRDRHKSIGNENEYKLWRNKVIKLIQKSKKDQYQTFIENNKKNPSSVYKIFREVGAGKCSHRQSTIGSIKISDLHTEDSVKIVNEFNDFFVNIASNLKEPITTSNHEKLRGVLSVQSSIWYEIYNSTHTERKSFEIFCQHGHK